MSEGRTDFAAVVQQINMRRPSQSIQQPSASASVIKKFLAAKEKSDKDKERKESSARQQQDISSSSSSSPQANLAINSEEEMRKLVAMKAKIFLRQCSRPRFFDDRFQFFSHWKKFTLESKNDLLASRLTLKKQVEEHLASAEKKMIVDLESENTRLKKALLCTIFFSRWKQKALEKTLHTERRKWASEREFIRRELVALRTNVQSCNEKEISLFEGALLRGETTMKLVAEICDNLND